MANSDRHRGRKRDRKRTSARKRSEARKLARRWLWIAPALVVAAALATLAFDRQTGLVPLIELWREASTIESEVHELEADRARLRARAVALKTDPLEVEALARERLEWVRDGEIVLRVGSASRD